MRGGQRHRTRGWPPKLSALRTCASGAGKAVCARALSARLSTSEST